mgnify:CR=1 FL=1
MADRVPDWCTEPIALMHGLQRSNGHQTKRDLGPNYINAANGTRWNEYERTI